MSAPSPKDKRSLLVFLSKKKKGEKGCTTESSGLSDECAEYESFESNPETPEQQRSDNSPSKRKHKRNRTVSSVTDSGNRLGNLLQKKKRRRNTNEDHCPPNDPNLSTPNHNPSKIPMQVNTTKKTKKHSKRETIFQNLSGAFSGNIIRTPDRRKTRQGVECKGRKLRRSVTEDLGLNGEQCPASPRSGLGRRISVGLFKTKEGESPKADTRGTTTRLGDHEKPRTVSAEELRALAMMNDGASESQGATEEEIKEAEQLLEKLEHPRVLSKQDLVNYFSSDENSSSGSQSNIDSSNYVPHSVLDAVLLLERKRKKEKRRLMEEARMDVLPLPFDDNLFDDLHLPDEVIDQHNESFSRSLKDSEKEEDPFSVSEPSVSCENLEDQCNSVPKDNSSDDFMISSEGSDSLSLSAEEREDHLYSMLISKGEAPVLVMRTRTRSLNNRKDSEDRENDITAEELEPTPAEELRSSRSIVDRMKPGKPPLGERVPSLSAMESSLDMELDEIALWRRKSSQASLSSHLRWDSNSESPVIDISSENILIDLPELKHKQESSEERQQPTKPFPISPKENSIHVSETADIDILTSNMHEKSSEQDLSGPYINEQSNEMEPTLPVPEPLEQDILEPHINEQEQSNEIEPKLPMPEVLEQDILEPHINEQEQVNEMEVELSVSETLEQDLLESHINEEEQSSEMGSELINSDLKKKSTPDIQSIIAMATSSPGIKNRFRFGGAKEYCSGCSKVVYQMERILALGRVWHRACFRCDKCQRVLPPHVQYEIDKKPLCKNHYNMYVR